ncbi:MAG: hypothetical protein LCH41_01515 [Armatimonadetes bacterium]|nr:hypothetical protein [Armatimonadota bacterium]
MKRTHRNRGFSIAEMMISSVVLVTVIAMSLNVMLTSAKISRNVIREYGNSNGSRHAADKILSEAQHAYAALSRVDVDGTVFTAHEDNTLIIAKYRTDASGTIVPNSRDLFIYQVITAGPRQQLWEIQAKQLDGMPAEGVSKKMVADNLRKFHYRLSRHETLSPVAGVYGSPMNLVSGEPSGNQARLTAINAPWKGKQIHDDSDSIYDFRVAIPYQDGLLPAELASIGMSRSGNNLSFSDADTSGRLDVLLEVDERYSSNAQDETRANELSCWIVTQQRDQRGVSELARSIEANLRNAK